MRTLTLLMLSFALAATGATKKAVHPKEFAKGRPYSPGILTGDTLYVSGLVGQDLKTGKVPEDFEAEARLCFENIRLILKEGGMDFDNVVSVQVYLTDIELFQRMNAIYVTYFKEPRPARTTVGVTKLAAPARMEVTVTARK
ncbi:MAG: RidA family protein [Bryobacteraceae bacterium]